MFVSLSLRLCIAQDRSHWHFSGPLSLYFVDFSSQRSFLQEAENMKMLSPKIFEFFAAEAKVEKVRKIKK